MLNALSIDVEDYFHVSAFAGTICKEDWPNYESRAVTSTERILSVLDACGVKATFFFLGWVAERHPDLVRRVQREDHEIATHGYAHQLVTSQEPEAFRVDIARSLQILEEITGEKVLGYRAPSYSITAETKWALSILADLGLAYDSSVFPIRHDLGGMVDAPRHPYEIQAGFWEFPLTTWQMGRWNVPIAGGGYLRLYPLGFTRWVIGRLNREGIPAVVYVHPWEFDPEPPRIAGAPVLSRIRHYQNLGRTRGKLIGLCEHFGFAPMRDVLEDWVGRSQEERGKAS